ncbi:MAG: RES family NAD+ phosphorylase [Actinomycetota bacterium]
MITPVPRRLPNTKQWYRVADEKWDDPLDPSFAQKHGGRWNPPNSYPTLYLNEDVETARAQIYHMLEGSPVRPEDLDPPYVLITATLPSRQVVADAVTDVGLRALGLSETYPVDVNGEVVPRSTCQPIGRVVKDQGLRGVHALSAATYDGTGRELAWFPARTASKATPIDEPIPFRTWWYADSE